MNQYSVSNIKRYKLSATKLIQFGLGMFDTQCIIQIPLDIQENVCRCVQWSVKFVSMRVIWIWFIKPAQHFLSAFRIMESEWMFAYHATIFLFADYRSTVVWRIFAASVAAGNSFVWSILPDPSQVSSSLSLIKQLPSLTSVIFVCICPDQALCWTHKQLVSPMLGPAIAFCCGSLLYRCWEDYTWSYSSEND